MRLFVAVRPPEPALQHLAAHLGRPVDPRWHLTLVFLGEVADPGPVTAGLGGLPGPFAVALAGGETFAGRVLWAGVGVGREPLTRLAVDVADRLGITLPDRHFRPHLTVRRGRDLDAAPLASYAGPNWTAREVELVRISGGRHETLSRHPLDGP